MSNASWVTPNSTLADTILRMFQPQKKCLHRKPGFLADGGATVNAKSHLKQSIQKRSMGFQILSQILEYKKSAKNLLFSGSIRGEIKK